MSPELFEAQADSVSDRIIDALEEMRRELELSPLAMFVGICLATEGLLQTAPEPAPEPLIAWRKATKLLVLSILNEMGVRNGGSVGRGGGVS